MGYTGRLPTRGIPTVNSYLLYLIYLLRLFFTIKYSQFYEYPISYEYKCRTPGTRLESSHLDGVLVVNSWVLAYDDSKST